MTDIEELKSAARKYWKEGLNIVPMHFYKEHGRTEKHPLIKWEQLQTKRQAITDLENLPWHKAQGLAVVAGETTKRLHFCCVDLDFKNASEKAKQLGEEIFNALPRTREEITVNGGKHKFFLSRNPVRTDSKYHSYCALELLGNNKLIVVYPSDGYKKNNNESIAEIEDVNELFEKELDKCNTKPKEPQFWFDKRERTGKAYRKSDPPCIRNLFRGVIKGKRDNTAIRMASYLINFRKLKQTTVRKRMKEWNKKKQTSSFSRDN